MKDSRSIIAYYNELSKDYDRLYAREQLDKYTILFRAAYVDIEHANILVDLGCGTGLLLEYLQVVSGRANTIYYLCIDFSLGMISRAVEKHRSRKLYYVDYVVADVNSIPLRKCVGNVVFVMVSVLRQGEENIVLRLKEAYSFSTLVVGLLVGEKNKVCPKLGNCKLVGKVGYECLYIC